MDVLQCSFCKKSQDEVRKLIAGPTVNICDECVEVCVDIIVDDTRARDVSPDSVESQRSLSMTAKLVKHHVWRSAACAARRRLRDICCQSTVAGCGAANAQTPSKMPWREACLTRHESRFQRLSLDGLDSLARTDGKIGADRAYRAASGRRDGSAVSPESDPDASVEPDDRREHQWPFADQSARVGRQATRPLLPVLFPSRR